MERVATFGERITLKQGFDKLSLSGVEPIRNPKRYPLVLSSSKDASIQADSQPGFAGPSSRYGPASPSI